LGRDLEDPKKLVALKFIRSEVLANDESALQSLKQEIKILNGLKHPNINKFIDYGSDGKIVKPSGRVIPNLIYIILDYVPGGIFYDLCQAAGGVGEQGGRYFLDQLLDAVNYMHKQNVVHRDLKPENILVGDNLNLVVADFGYATYKKIHNLYEYCGTKVYMAPEISEQKPYDGRKSDIFALGVILFVIVLCKFPFSKAQKDEYYYKLILDGKFKEYWDLTGDIKISDDFKDLTMKMLSYNPKDRPSIDEIYNHPWMQNLNSHKAEKDILRQLRANDTYKMNFKINKFTS
jgi:serine/threonine protein kinase